MTSSLSTENHPLRSTRHGARLAALAVLAIALAVGGCGGGDRGDESAAQAEDPGVETSNAPPVGSGRIPVPSTAEAGLPHPDSLHARPHLASETNFVIPGEAHMLGVIFEMDPDWHIYGNLRNDTGMPPTIRLDLPEGFTAGEVIWPVPARHVSPGNILDHVYTGRVALLIPVQVPADLPTGEMLTLRGRADWLVCADVCLPEAAALAITLPVAETRSGALSLLEKQGLPPLPATVREDGRAFAMTRLRTAPPLPEEFPMLTRSWEGNTLHLGMETAASLHFYPAKECPELVDAIADAEVAANAMALRFKELPTAEQPVTGILEFRFPPEINVPPKVYTISLPGPSGPRG